MATGHAGAALTCAPVPIDAHTMSPLLLEVVARRASRLLTELVARAQGSILMMRLYWPKKNAAVDPRWLLEDSRSKRRQLKGDRQSGMSL